MIEPLRIVTVQSDGDPGEQLGTLSLAGEQIQASDGIAAETLAVLRRRSKLDDLALFSYLAKAGWSNGQIMIAR